ncbi:MAG TPA: ChbG/HpnK family deacetylase [Methylocella sp.]|nr:ChbG/HpnK family deacetylase [Methylocella sp.]
MDQQLNIAGLSGAPISFCLCADDFALARGVSHGILEALALSRVSATSVLTTSPRWPDGAKALQAFRGQADIGLHLNLTLGRPLGPMPQLAGSGQFPDVAKLVQASLKRALPESEITQEIFRQLDRFITHFGSWPDFVDGHQHVHILPQIRAALLGCLTELKLAGQIWIRSSGDRPLAILRRRREYQKALGIAWLGRGFARQAAAKGFPVNDSFAGYSNFDPGADYAQAFRSYLRAPGRHHLIMCHPGFSDAELAAIDPVTASREKELDFLLSPSFPALLAQKGARLTRLSQGLLRGP